MASPACSEAEFIRLFETIGPAETARRLGLHERSVFTRRSNLEKKLQLRILGPDEQRRFVEGSYPHRAAVEVENGIVLVGSDAHIWPGEKSVAMRAFIKFAKELKPKAVVLNGDVMDFPRISRHDPLGWEKQPEVQEEIEAAQAELGEIESAAGRAEKIWCLGNHDARYETRLASVAPEYRGVHGKHLKDFFPLWRPAWSAWINDAVVVKHRFKGGIHAPHNNTMWAGKTMITGHLHSAKVVPFSDYNGTRYGVDTGCLANPDGPQFVNYTEDAPKNWRSAFGVLTFHKGRLLQPELVMAFGGDSVEWRGRVEKV